MKTRHFCCLLLMWAMLMGVATGAGAQAPSKVYMIATVGDVKHDMSLQSLNATYGLGGAGDTATISDDHGAAKIGFGYRFNETFAIEGAYGRLAKTTYNVTRAGGGQFQLAVQPEVLQLAGIASIPMSKTFRLFGKAGVAHIRNTGDIINVNGACPNGGIVCDPGTKSDDTNLMYGIGVDYDMGSNLLLRAEWEHYASYRVAEASDLRPVFGPLAQQGGEVKVKTDVFSIGVGYRF